MPDSKSFSPAGLLQFLKIGAPSMMMACIELWSFECMAILAAMMSVESIAVQVIVINNGHTFYAPHFGL